MNAYFASLMLLVFNAVGLAMPETDTVAEERIAPDANLDHEQEIIDLAIEKSKDGLQEDCNSSQNISFDVDSEQSGQLLSVVAGLHSEALDLKSSKVFAAYRPPNHVRLPDNQYVEGAP